MPPTQLAVRVSSVVCVSSDIFLYYCTCIIEYNFIHIYGNILPLRANLQ